MWIAWLWWQVMNTARYCYFGQCPWSLIFRSDKLPFRHSSASQCWWANDNPICWWFRVEGCWEPACHEGVCCMSRVPEVEIRKWDRKEIVNHCVPMLRVHSTRFLWSTGFQRVSPKRYCVKDCSNRLSLRLSIICWNALRKACRSMYWRFVVSEKNSLWCSSRCCVSPSLSRPGRCARGMNGQFAL